MVTDTIAQPVISDTVLVAALAVVGMFIIYLMIREMRVLKTMNRNAELELEKEKLRIIQQHAETKMFPFTRLSPEQTAAIRQVEDENSNLETTIFAKEKMVESRLTRLENLVKSKKLDTFIGKIDNEERRVK